MAEESNYWSVLHRHFFVATKNSGPQAFVYMYTWILKDLYMEARI